MGSTSQLSVGLVVCFLVIQAQALAPAFDAFSSAATGAWDGSRYTWSATALEDHVEVSTGAGDRWWLAVPQKAETSCEEVMRSCGGAVQGVRVSTDGVEGVVLNRQDDGFVFFDDGSWCLGPTSLEALALDVCLQHGDRSRRRVRAVLDPASGAPRVAEVVHEAPRGDADAFAVCDGLLSGRVSVVAECAAWDGGARRAVTAAAATPWLAPRAKWTASDADVAGGAPLVPAGATALPGGIFLAAARGDDDAFDVSVGSIAFSEDGEGEVVSTTRSYRRGQLVSVSLERILPRDDEGPTS